MVGSIPHVIVYGMYNEVCLGIPHNNTMSHDHVVCDFDNVVCQFEKKIPYRTFIRNMFLI